MVATNVEAMKRVAMLALFGLFLFKAPALADGGGLRGVIYEGTAHEGLTGVDVGVSGPAGVVHTFSDRKGFFVFLGLLPGTYTITLVKPDYYSFRCTRTVAEVQVDSDEVRDVAFELHKVPLAWGMLPCRTFPGPEKIRPSIVDPGATADIYDVH